MEPTREGVGGCGKHFSGFGRSVIPAVDTPSRPDAARKPPNTRLNPARVKGDVCGADDCPA